MPRRLQAWAVAATLSMIASAWVSPSVAWNPLNDVKKAVNFVGGAAGGVLHFGGNILGQGLAGLAGPVIQDAGAEFQRVAGATLGQVDKIAEKRIDQVSDRILGALTTADHNISERIKDIDILLTKKIGDFDVVGTKQINNFETAVAEILRYASLLFLATAGIFIVFSIFAKRYLSGQATLPFFQPAGWTALGFLALGASVIFVTSNFLSPPSTARIATLRTDLINSYKASLELGDPGGSVFYASQLSTLDSTKFGSRLLVQLADLQRDLISRPALTKTPKGILELRSRAGMIGRTWALLKDSGEQLGELNFLDYELSATAAVIAWQTGQSHQDEIDAQCAAANALVSFQEHVLKGKTPEAQRRVVSRVSPYLWLNYSYLKWGQVRNVGVSLSCRSVEDGKDVDFPVAMLRQTVEAFDFVKDDPHPLVSHVVAFNDAATTYYGIASRLYPVVLITDAQYRYKAVASEKQAHKDERDKAIDGIVVAWSNFGKALQAIPGLQGNDLVLAATGLGAGLATRGVLLKGTGDGPRPAFDQAACNALLTQIASGDPATHALGEKHHLFVLASLMDPQFRPLICGEQVGVDARLVLLESEIQKVYAPGGGDFRAKKSDLTLNTSLKPIMAGLATCIRADVGAIRGDRGCNSPSEIASDSQPLLDWLEGKKGDPAATPRYAMVR